MVKRIIHKAISFFIPLAGDYACFKSDANLMTAHLVKICLHSGKERTTVDWNKLAGRVGLDIKKI